MTINLKAAPKVPFHSLGISQIISYGCLFYAFAQLKVPLAADIGVEPSDILAAVTGALLIQAFLAPLIGGWIDKFGALTVMTRGLMIGAVGITSLPAVDALWWVWLCMVPIGLGFAMSVDPQNGVQVPIVSQVKFVIATLLFLAIDGHLMLVSAVFESFALVPLTNPGFAATGFENLVSLGSQLFASALLLGLPTLTAVATPKPNPIMKNKANTLMVMTWAASTTVPSSPPNSASALKAAFSTPMETPDA